MGKIPDYTEENIMTKFFVAITDYYKIHISIEIIIFLF